jgi:hypothetical protein
LYKLPLEQYNSLSHNIQDDETHHHSRSDWEPSKQFTEYNFGHSQVLTIFVQGAAVLEVFIKESGWKIRGITRDPTKDAAKALEARGVEIVKADIEDVESLKNAFKV